MIILSLQSKQCSFHISIRGDGFSPRKSCPRGVLIFQQEFVLSDPVGLPAFRQPVLTLPQGGVSGFEAGEGLVVLDKGWTTACAKEDVSHEGGRGWLGGGSAG